MTANLTLTAWLRYIEQLHPKTIDLGLDRIQAVAKRLGILSVNSPVITIAGTNGKGSCVATLTAILEAQGYRVGAYFSPHFKVYNERIHIAGEFVSDDALCRAFSAIDIVRRDVSLTYFEWGTLAALWLFKEANLDVLILEVGLGGRLDAVNIIDADIAVITTIDLDHMEWLGCDRELIGKEKAGIFRYGKVAVCGDFNPPQSVYDAAQELKVPLYCQGIDFGYIVKGEHWEFWSTQNFNKINLPMPQLLLQNVSTAFMVLSLLSDTLTVSNGAIHEGLSNVFLPGRFQITGTEPLVILDVAHNPQGCQKLADRLKNEACVTGKTCAVVGMLADKEHRACFNPLLACIDEWYVASLPGERAVLAEQLSAILSRSGASTIYPFDSVLEAYYAALSQATVNDRIIVFGSFYTVGPVLDFQKSI